MNLSHVRSDIDRLIAGELTTEQHRQVRAHVRDCTDCAQYYEEQRSVEDDLFASAGMAPSAIERMQELVLDEVGTRRRPFWSWSAMAVFAAAAAALVIWVQRPSSEFTARGSSAAQPGAGIALFAIDPASRSARHVGNGEHLPRGTVIEVAYSNSDFDYAAVVAVDGDGDFTWFYDTAVAHDVRQEPLRGGWTLSDTPATVRIFAIFSKAPIDKGEVERAIAGSKGASRGTSPRLGSFSAQDSIEVHID